MARPLQIVRRTGARVLPAGWPDLESILKSPLCAEFESSGEIVATKVLTRTAKSWIVEHEKIWFDCRNQRSLRLEELRMAAKVAADKVRSSGTSYQFAPMSSRERRIVHLALREQEDLHTESEGEGTRRFVVVYPKGQEPAPRADSRRR